MSPTKQAAAGKRGCWGGGGEVWGAAASGGADGCDYLLPCVAVLAVVAVGVAAVAMLVGTAQLRGGAGTTVLLDMRHVKPARARTEMLWFGPGISDELNRMIKLGKVSRDPPCCSLPRAPLPRAPLPCAPRAGPAAVVCALTRSCARHVPRT